LEFSSKLVEEQSNLNATNKELLEVISHYEDLQRKYLQNAENFTKQHWLDELRIAASDVESEKLQVHFLMAI
jgi:uncharacterized protein (DUF433 family)